MFLNFSFMISFVMAAFLLSGCAIVGSGNPIGSYEVDSSKEDSGSVICPESKPNLQKKPTRGSKITLSHRK